MKKLLKDKRFYIGLLIVAGLVTASQAASFLLYGVSGLDPLLARPWTIWYYINDPIFIVFPIKNPPCYTYAWHTV